MSRQGKQVTRRAAALATALALVIPPAAQGVASTGYAGAFAGAGELSFTLKMRKGERKVKEWAWSGLRLTCGANSQTTSGRYLFSMEVRHRSFSGRAVRRSNSGAVVGGAKVWGKFTPAYAAAEGQFRVYGETPEGHEDCESGLVNWTAKPEVAPPRG